LTPLFRACCTRRVAAIVIQPMLHSPAGYCADSSPAVVGSLWLAAVVIAGELTLASAGIALGVMLSAAVDLSNHRRRRGARPNLAGTEAYRSEAPPEALTFPGC